MVCLTVTGVYLLLLLGRAALALAYASRYPAAPARSRAGEVTILQPLLSGDPGLAAALADNLRELPEAAFLWLVDEDDVEGREVSRGLAERFPESDLRILVLPDPPPGVNPKLWKLEAAWPEARREVCLVLDDDTRLPSRSLNALVEALDGVELATGLPFYRAGKDLPSRLLAQFVNDNAGLTYLPLLHFQPPVSINGMCYALRRGTLEEMGGFAPLLHHLTDDLAVACRVREHGGRLRQTPFPQEVETHVASPRQYARQMHRWFLFGALLLRRQTPATRVVIGVLQGVPPVLLWTALLSAVLAPSTAAGAAVAGMLVLRAGTLALLQRRLTGTVRTDLLLSLLSELLQPLHLAHAVCVRSIRWRSRHYRVRDNDRFEPL